MKEERNTPPEESDWENRKLCSDPACIGVIGPDGRCKECGKPFEGEATAAAPPVTETAETEPSGGVWESEPPADLVDEEEVEEDCFASDQEWKNRKLCSDPACIGVIGADGRCKECGKRAAEE